MRAVIGDFEILQTGTFESVDEGVDRAVAEAFDGPFFAVDEDARLALDQSALAGLVNELVFDEIHRRGDVHELLEERLADFIGRKLAAVLVGEIINALAD